MADDHSLCSRDLIEAAADSCAFARQHCASDAAGLFGSYVPLYYCQLSASPAAFAPLCALLLLLTICCLGSTADLFFIPQLTLLSELLVLPPAGPPSPLPSPPLSQREGLTGRRRRAAAAARAGARARAAAAWAAAAGQGAPFRGAAAGASAAVAARTAAQRT